MTVKKMKIGPGVFKLNAPRTVQVTTTSGSATITGTGPTFTSGDVGASVTGVGVPAGATLLSVESPTAATLSAAATADGTPQATITPTGGVQDFSCQITSGIVEWKDDEEDSTPVLCGDEEPGDITWSASISGNMIVDPDQAQWTWDHKGETFPGIYIPSNAAAKQVVGTVRVKPLPFGGDVKTTARADFDWPFIGEPDMQNVPV